MLGRAPVNGTPYGYRILQYHSFNGKEEFSLRGYVPLL